MPQQGMPDKRLAYKSSVSCILHTDSKNKPATVRIIERWGKGNKTRARTRTLTPDTRGYPGTGIAYTHHGAVTISNTVYWIVEQNNNKNWWVEPIEWGEKPPERENDETHTALTDAIFEDTPPVATDKHTPNNTDTQHQHEHTEQEE